MASQPNRLSRGESFKLMKLVEAEYSTYAVSDREFAEYASKTLGFPISPSSVLSCRNEFDIPPTRELKIPLETRVKDLESDLATLSMQVANLIEWRKTRG